MTNMRRLGEAVNRLRHWGAGTLLSLFLVPIFGTPASAQIFVGNGARPQVEVDTSVLDRLGNEPTLPDLFLGGKTPSSKLPGGKSSVAETSEGRVLGLHQPHPIVLKKPGHHKAVKPKVAVAAAKRPVTQVVAAAPPVASPLPEPKPDSKPAEAAKPAAEPDLPAVSLPVIVPQETPATAKTDNKPEAKPETVIKHEAKAASAPVKAGKTEKSGPQAAPPVPPKLAATPTPPLPDKPAPLTPAAPAEPAQAPAAVATAAPPAATTAPVESQPPAAPSVPSPAAATPAAPPAEHEQQEAHLTPAVPTSPPSASGSIEAPMTILFEKDGAALPDEVRTSLAQLAERLATDTTSQIQLLAYAEGDEDNASKARRLSLSRALAVRSYLIDQGVRSTRIEVRALGNKVPEGPADRVDVLIQKR